MTRSPRSLAFLTATLLAAAPACGASRPSAALRASTTSSTVPATVPLPAPAQFVAHLPTGTAHPGPIVVIDTASGATVRMLGADYDPYVGDGFHIAAGGLAVFWTHLDEPAQRFPISEVPVVGGAARTVADGFDDLPSPDGSTLLIQEPHGPTISFALVNLATGATRSLPLPALAGQVFEQPSWLPDGHTILALAMTPGVVCNTPAGGTCPTTTTTPAETVHAWTIDSTDPRATWTPVSSTPGAWDGVVLLGPGRVPSTVAAYQTDQARGSGAATALLTMTTEGSVIDRVAIQAQQVLAVDHTGTNFLVIASNGLAHLSLAQPTPVAIGPAVAQATWW